MLLPLIAFVLIIPNVNAQSDNIYMEMSREVLKKEKKAAVIAHISLSDEESTLFWELYKEYSSLYKGHNKRIAIIEDYSRNFESLSDEKPDEIWVDYTKLQKEVLKIKTTYYKNFKKILPAGETDRFVQIENKIEVLIDASLALEVPLIETKY